MHESNVINFVPKDTAERETCVDTQLLLTEWGFHIFASALCLFVCGATALCAICVLADLALASELTLQITEAIFDNPVTFAVVWGIVFLLIIGCVAVKTVDAQKRFYLTFDGSGSKELDWEEID